uniref:Uncharacterized protein n=1 Tax=Ciona savignyi TaxID=51511 RepID=H2ZQC6_CIOSA
MVYQCEITKQWNGEPIDHDPVKMKLEGLENGVKLTIDAPYFNDPAPKGETGKPLWLLWEYEVVEAFFLNSKTGEYYEVEFGPHGQHLGLLFKKCREVWKKNLEMEYSSKITGNTWTGCAVMPWDYLPAGVDKFNAFAMHGVDA